MSKEAEKKKDKVEEDLEKEAEDSLENRTPIKRKPENVPKGRKAKRLKFEKLEGWGEEPAAEPKPEQLGGGTGCVKGTLESDRSPGVGTSPGWKSSQGGTTIRTTDSRGARVKDHTLPEGWINNKVGSKGGVNRPDWGEGGMNMPTTSLRNTIIIQENETIPEGGKVKPEDNIDIGGGDVQGPEVGEGGMNVPTASLRNTIIIQEDETIPEGGKAKPEDNLMIDRSDEQGPGRGEGGMNMPTASLRNTSITQEDETIPEGWKVKPEENLLDEACLGRVGGVHTPTASWRNKVKPEVDIKTVKLESPVTRRRVRGRLSKREVIQMKKSCHNIEEMLKMKKDITPNNIIFKEQDEPLGPKVAAPNIVLCEPVCVQTGSSVHIVHSDQNHLKVHTRYGHETPLCTRYREAGIGQHVTSRGTTDMRKVAIPASPSMSPGGGIIFKEGDIKGVEEMIRRWEDLERSEEDAKETRKESGGRRVSELTQLFEEGGEDMGHIRISGGGSGGRNFGGHSDRLSAENLKNTHSAPDVYRNIMKLETNQQPRQNFISQTSSHYRDDANSGEERDWSSLTNHRQAETKRQNGN